MRVDVLVVGSGASGASAALAAAQRGAKVAVVRRGYGATAMTSGALRLDLPPDLPAAAQRSREEIEDIVTSVLGFALLPRRSSFLTALGRVVEADLVWPSMVRGTLDSLEGRRLAVVQIEGLTEVRAKPIVRKARQLGIDAREVRLPFPEAKHAHDLSTPELARLCDDLGPAEKLAKALAGVTEEFDLIALPPLAGLIHWHEVSVILDEALGTKWFELVAALPSVPGMRQQQELDASLRAAGVSIIHGPVLSWAEEGESIVALRVGLAEGERVIETSQLVLATGGLIGRGLTSVGDDVRESILSLPVELTRRQGSQAAEGDSLSAGVGVSDDLRAVNSDGVVIFANVRVVGELTGFSYGSGRGGLPAAVSAGWAAGELAARDVTEGESIQPESWQAVEDAGDPLGCLNCGLCLSRCPTVRALSREKNAYPGPRGMMSGLIRFESELDGVADELSLCTLCGACSAVCPACVPVAENITRARQILGDIAPDAGPSAYQSLRAAFDQPKQLFDAEPIEGPRLDKAECVLFVGCSLPYYEREDAEGTIKILQALGVDFTLINEVCCGGPLEVIGAEGALELAEHNLAEFARVGARRIISCCPRCAETMSTLEPYRGLEIEHTTSLLARILPGTTVAANLREKLTGQQVTFHDPCERARLAGEIEHAREVMREVGIEVLEMPRSGTFTDCCGAGGGVRAAQTKTSLRMARLRVADAVATGAPVLLTECPSCLHNLFNGRKRKQNIEIGNLSSYLGHQL